MNSTRSRGFNSLPGLVVLINKKKSLWLQFVGCSAVVCKDFFFTFKWLASSRVIDIVVHFSTNIQGKLHSQYLCLVSASVLFAVWSPSGPMSQMSGSSVLSSRNCLYVFQYLGKIRYAIIVFETQVFNYVGLYFWSNYLLRQAFNSMDLYFGSNYLVIPIQRFINM